MIGIMQGRLLPPVGGRIQAFPGAGWQREFALAGEIGFRSIELTIETASLETHPVMSERGRAELAALSAAHGVALAGLCCDVFMETPFKEPAAAPILDRLIAAAAAAGLPMIELPMLGANSLRDEDMQSVFGAVLAPALARAEAAGIDILLECDLAPDALAAFMARNRHTRLGINYDCGNSTWFGFAPEDEIPALARDIRNVHIKDCTRADYSVPLGAGETRFDAVFGLLAQAGYRGDFIVQAARQPDDLAAARDYLAFGKRLVGRHLAA
jgi:hexulose-6-phosphate isomerase